MNRPAQAGGASDRVASADLRVDGDTIVVYRSPTCGCCKAWEDHMRAAGFTVQSVETSELEAVKSEQAIPQPLRSCHTGVVGGYVIEGHVPAQDVARLLAERPDLRGLAVPGMPAGSPGMDVPGRENDPFEVFAFREDGEAEVWATR
jgi:hypothetical protein